MSIRTQLNELIDFYDKHMPGAAREIPVCATANTVRKFARKRKGKYLYRKRVIIPIRPVRTRDEIDDEKHRHA